MKSMQTEEQKIEAIRESFMDAYAEMEKTIAGIADVLKETDQ